MSRTIDEKVVSLQFDNAEFEKNVRTSMRTLEDFEKKSRLDGASKGIEDVERAANKFNLGNIVAQSELAQKSFSTLEKLSIGVFAEIGRQATLAGERIMYSLTGIEQFNSGHDKYKEKIASVQTLVNATGKSVDDINSYLDTLMRFSDETSYGFTQMASSLSQLATSGGELDSLLPMIMGIANATAFAGKTQNEFSRAIYNLNQSYGAGYLKYMDWKSLELAGVASKQLKQAFIDTAIAVGQLDANARTVKGTIVDIGNFGETLKDNWATTEVMEKTFGLFYKYTAQADEMVRSGAVDTYTEAYREMLEANADLAKDTYFLAAKAAQEATTFEQAVTATKDAVSSKWMASFDIVFGNYEQAKKTWSQVAEDLYTIFAEPGNRRNNFLKSVFNDTYTQFKDYLEDEAGVSLKTFESSFSKYLTKQGNNVDYIIEKYGSLKNAFNSDDLIGNILKKQLDNFFTDIQEGKETLEGTVSSLEKFQQVFNDIWAGNYGNGQERIDKLTEAGYDYAAVQQLINKLAQEGHKGGYELTAKDIEHLSEAELENLGISADEANALKELASKAKDANEPISKLIKNFGRKSGVELFSEIITNLTGTIANLREAVGNAWEKVFNADLAEIVYKIVLKINEFTGSIKTATAEGTLLSTILKGIGSVLNTIGKVFSLFGEIVSQVFKGISVSIGKYFDFKIVEDGITALNDNASTALDNAVQWLQENQIIFDLVQGAADAVVGAIKYIKDWLNTILENDTVKTVLDNIKTNFKNFSLENLDIKTIYGYFKNLKFDDIKTSFNNLIGGLNFTALSDTFNSIFSGQDITSPDGIAKSIETATLTVAEVAGKSGGTLTKAGVALDEGFKKVLEPLNLTPEQFAEIGKKFKKGSETLLGYLMTGLVFKGFSNLTTSLSNVISSLVTPLESVSNLLIAWKNAGMALGSAFISLKDYFIALRSQVQINSLLKMSVAIGILVSVCFLMAKIDEATMWKAIYMVGVLSLAIGAMVYLMTKNDNLGAINNAKFSDLALVFIALAASLLIITKVLKSLDSIKNLVGTGLTALIAFLVMIGGAIALIKIVGKDAGSVNVVAIAGLLVALGLGFKLMAGAISVLAKLKIEDVWSFIGGLVAALSILIVGTKALRNVKAGAIIPLIGLAAALYLFTQMLQNLAEIDFKKVYQSIIKMIPVMAVIGVLLKMIKGISGSVASIGVMFVGLAAGVLLVIQAIKAFGGIDGTELLKGGAAVTTLMVVLGVIVGKILGIVLMKKDIPKRTAGTIAAMALLILSISASIYLLVGAVMIFKSFDPWELIRGVGAVVALLLSIGGMIGLMNHGFANVNLFTVQAMKAIVTMIIGVLAGMIILAHMPINQVLTTAGSLTLVFGSLALMMWAISSFAKIKKIQPNNILSLIGIIAAAGALLWILSKTIKDPSSAIKVAEALAITLISIAASISVLSLAVGKLSNISWIGIGKVVVEMVAMLVLAGGALWALSSVIKDPSSLMDITTSLSVLMISLSAAMIGMSIAASISSGVNPAALWNLIGAVGVITAVVGAVSYLLDSFIQNGALTEESLDRMIGIAGKIGEFIGTFFGSIAGSLFGAVSDQIMESFANIGAKLSEFAENVKGFITLEIPETFSNTISAFGEILKLLGLNIGTINTLGSSDTKWEDFNSFMSNYADAIKKFSKALGGSINADAVNAAANAGTMFAELSKALGSNRSGGLINSVVDLFLGKQETFGSFATNMEKFGSGLVKMSKALTKDGGIDTSAVENAINAGKMLTEFEKTTNRTGGLVNWLLGQQSLGDFGDRISNFTMGLVSMSNIMAKFDTSSTSKAVEAGKALSELEKSLASSPSLMGLITGGDQSLGNFGTRISAFASNLKIGLESFGEMFSDTVSSEGLPNQDTLSNYEKISANVDNAVKIGNKFVELETALAGNAGVFGEKSTIGEFGKGIKSFSTGINAFSENVASIVLPTAVQITTFERTCEMVARLSFLEMADNAKEKFISLGDIANSIGTGISNLTTSISGIGEGGTETFETVLKSFFGNTEGQGVDLLDSEKTIENVRSTLSSVGAEITQYEGGSGPLADAKSTISTFITDILALFDKKDKAIECARNILDGFRIGISDEELLGSVYAAVDAFASGVISRLQFSWDINSPSRVTAELGRYLLAGVAVGIKDETSFVADEAYKSGISITESIADAISMADSILENGLDPVISPVLDLSNIQNGANSIASILDTDASYRAALAVSNSRLAMAGVGNQNGAIINPVINVEFTVNEAGNQLTSEEISRFGKQIADEANVRLGKMLWR